MAYDSDIETPEFPWHDVEDGTQRFSGVGSWSGFIMCDLNTYPSTTVPYWHTSRGTCTPVEDH